MVEIIFIIIKYDKITIGILFKISVKEDSEK